MNMKLDSKLQNHKWIASGLPQSIHKRCFSDSASKLKFLTLYHLVTFKYMVQSI